MSRRLSDPQGQKLKLKVLNHNVGNKNVEIQ